MPKKFPIEPVISPYQSSEAPLYGEVWMDAVGTLGCIARDEESFYAFGAYDTIPFDNELVAHPLRRVFLRDGTLDPDFTRLPYPNGSVFGTA